MTASTFRFGFVPFAEIWHGRLAMLGFVIARASLTVSRQPNSPPCCQGGGNHKLLRPEPMQQQRGAITD